MTGTTVRPRATHDIGMIVVVEKMTADFAECFWQFVREGGYRPEKRKQEEAPKYELYRFVNGKPNYPEMIELLSRHPDILGEPKGLTLAEGWERVLDHPLWKTLNVITLKGPSLE